jgi:hypothetical protein
MTRRICTIGVLGFALLLSACTATAPGTGTPAPTTGATTPSGSSRASNLPYAGAPKVSSPLPPSVTSGDPCQDALTPEQITTLMGSPVQRNRNDTPNVGSTRHADRKSTLVTT